MKTGEQAVEYGQKTKPQLLVSELWAIRGNCEEIRAQKIAKRAKLLLQWLDKMPSLNGSKGMEKLRTERGVLLLRNRTSSFIDQFQHPIGRCAKFYKLTAYNNCNFWCEYCYLYLTFRNMPISTHFVNYDKMFREIIRFDKTNIPDMLRVLNLGELCDPLAVEDVTGFAEELIPFVAEETYRTKLLFLTKSDNIDFLLNLNHRGRSIMSFSINTDKVYQQLEHRTESPDARLLAARKLQLAGYEVRLRIDPIILYSTWEQGYIELVDKIFDYIKPSRITLGEYRPSKGLISHISSRFPNSPLLKINSGLVNDGIKLRYPDKYRLAMFKKIISAIRQHDTQVKIALCKEDVKIWKSLNLPINGLYCNCLE
ncbi:MAG: spore photoproduct lyase family protein [Nitrospirota bacterium]